MVAVIKKDMPTLVSNKTPLQVAKFHEPSLGFLLGTHAVEYSSMKNAVEKLKSKHSLLLIVDNKRFHFIKDIADQEQIKLKVIHQLRAFEYPNGRFKTYDFITLKHK